MESVHWQRVRELFDRALDLDPDSRLSFVKDSTVDEPVVRKEVLRLLQADESSSSLIDEPFLSTPLVELTEPFEEELSSGMRIGPYEVRSVVAKGGMGTVYEAVQERPARTVAVKTLRHGFSSKARARHFEFEVEALGRLQHPGIAQIYDAGVFERGGVACPYFAMEFVHDASDVLTYASEHRLTRNERLELMLDICSAVEHGHRKGVIHRDLKPGNLLVGRDGRTKVIDFGLARTAHPETSSISVDATRSGQILGTLSYMSPEHVSGRPQAIDVRSDVFSLGCVLYELLTSMPARRLEGLSVAQAALRIPHESVPRARNLPSELTWILSKAVALDPEERYASVSEFGRDITRYLSHEPVLAGPPSAGYRIRKFVRRHRGLLAAVLAVVAALSYGLVRARRSAQAAELALGQARRSGEAAEVALARAEVKSTNEAQVSNFLTNLFEGATPAEQGRDARVVDLLEAASRRLSETEEKLNPEPAAVLHRAVGECYRRLSRLDQAREHLQRAVRLAQVMEPDDATRIRIELAWVTFLNRTGEFAEARSVSVELLEQLLARGLDHDPGTFSAREAAADALSGLGRIEEAEALRREQLAAVSEAFGPRSRAVIHTRTEIGMMMRRRMLLDEARSWIEETLRMAQEELGRSDPQVIDVQHELGIALWYTDELERAERIFRGLLEEAEEHDGANSFAVFTCVSNLAGVLTQLGSHAEALELYERAFVIRDTIWGSSKQELPELLVSRAALLCELDRAADAERDLRRASAVAAELHPDGYPEDFSLQLTLGRALSGQGRYEEALALLEPLQREARAEHGLGDRRAIRASFRLAECYGRAGRLVQAEGLAVEMLDRLEPGSREEARWLDLAQELDLALPGR